MKKRVWQNNKWISVFVAGCFAVGGMSLGGCKNGGGKTADADETPATTEKQAPAVPVPDFNADSAYAFAAAQCAFGPRVPESPMHKKCGDWLVTKLKSFGWTVVEQTARVPNKQGRDMNIRNIIATLNPTAQPRLMLSAHWDTRPVSDEDEKDTNKPIDGANDGASGVAVLLEIARQFGAKPPGVGVEICLWDAEDGGATSVRESWCIGSQHWAATPHVPGYKAKFGINLDMVGAQNATFPQETYSIRGAGAQTMQIWQTAHELGYGANFPFQKLGEIIDDHFFVNKIAGIPYVDIIHLDVTRGGGFFPHWHTLGDKMDKLDRQTLKAVGQTVMTVVCRENVQPQ